MFPENGVTNIITNVYLIFKLNINYMKTLSNMFWHMCGGGVCG